MNMKFYRKLPIPQDIKTAYPVTAEMEAAKRERDREIKDIFSGKSDRFILIIGPCSADNSDSVLEYMGRLRLVADQVADRLMIIPRIYTNKPRTKGDGYMGMLHQPDPHKHPDMLKGLIAIRRLNMHALSDYGFSCADEMLYPDNHRYLSDLLSYVSVGARSVENQQHRLTASGLDIPVGMKNPTGGDLSVMMNAITAAHHGHTFIYRGWEVESSGNPYSHAILRGYVTPDGKTVPNYRYDDIMRTLELYQSSGLENPAVIIDTNHGNSGKNYEKQPDVAADVLESMGKSREIRRFCKGLMIESYLIDGAQKPEECNYGQSITDPCLGWEKTERLIFGIADRV